MKLLDTDRAPALVRDQVADHESNAVKYYLNEMVDFDTAAAFHQRPSNETVQRELRSATLLADSTARMGLTDEQRCEINRNHEIRRLRERCRRLTAKIRQRGYRNLKEAAGTRLGEQKRQTELRQKAKKKTTQTFSKKGYRAF
jgi:hypothetical protein